MAVINRNGYGIVEPNHLSGQRTGQIYAQLPAAKDIEVLENGQFVKYDYANGEVNFGDNEAGYDTGEWMMVWNEIKLYDERKQQYKDYAQIKSDFTPGEIVDPFSGKDVEFTHEGWGPFKGQMVPRVMKTNVGDIFTTNTLEQAGKADRGLVENTENLTVGAILSPNAKGFLSLTGDGTIKFQIVKIYNLADGQDAVKVMRIA